MAQGTMCWSPAGAYLDLLVPVLRQVGADWAAGTVTVAEEHRAGLAEGFYGSLFGPIRRTIAAAVESGEFRDNDPDFLALSFLGLALGMMEVGGPPGGPPGDAPGGDWSGPPTTIGATEAADRMADLFLGGALG